MLDPEISAAESRRLLSSPVGDVDDHGRLLGASDASDAEFRWTRRRFLRAVGMGIGAGLTIGTLGQELLGHEVPASWAGAPIGQNDGVLLHIFLYGGSDGLNIVVPYANGLYYDWRSTGTSIAAATVLGLDGAFGLHPSLKSMKGMWDAGRVAIVHGVGYRPPDLSHFSSMATWMSGTFGRPGASGWLGRWIDGQPASADLVSATVGTSVPLHLVGATRKAIAVPEGGGMLGAQTDATSQRTFAALAAMSSASSGGQWQDAFAGTLRSTVSSAAQLAPAFTPAVTGSRFVQQMTMAARLISRNVGMRVVDVGLGSFDTHDSEPNALSGLLTDLDAGLAAFFSTLDPSFRSRVTVMTSSEFGRTVQGNNSQGTDHGTANVHFVIGDNVRGGMYGATPALPAKTAANQWTRVDSTVDFRAVYGSVVDGWMGGGASSILGGAFEDLHLFAAGPGTIVSTPTPTPAPTPAPSPTPSPTLTPSGVTSGPLDHFPRTFGINSLGNAEKFWVVADEVLHSFNSASGWSPDSTLLGPSVGIRSRSVGTGLNFLSNQELYVVALDGQVWHNFATPGRGSGWNGWDSMGTPTVGIVGEVVVGRNSSNNQELYILGGDGQVWHNFAPPGKGSGWNGWDPMGAPPVGIAGDVHVSRNDKNNQELFVIGLDQQIWHNYATPGVGSGWSGWGGVGGVGASTDLAVWVGAKGVQEMFVVAAGTLYHNWATPGVGSGWSGWSSLGAPSGVALTSLAGVDPAAPLGTWTVYAGDTSGGLWALPTTAAGWAVWRNTTAPTP